MIKHFDKNENGRDFVVGDIHGCFDLLRDKLKEISFDAKTDRLFSVGDLVDRGEKSAECAKWLNKSWFHAVRGNHEQMAIDYIPYAKDIYRRNGGQWFIDLPEYDQTLFKFVFERLPIAIEIETNNGLVGIIHAEQPFNSWTKLQERLSHNNGDNRFIIECCLWDRTRFEQQDKSVIDGIYRVYCGHTPTNTPVELGNVTYIDTGAVFCGNLTVLQIN